MSPPKPVDVPLMFSCDFPCICGSVIGLKTRVAIVKSATGAEVTCVNCKQRFHVTEKGALPISGMAPMDGVRQIVERIPIEGEIPPLRLPQPGGPSEHRPAETPVWAMRLSRMRRNT